MAASLAAGVLALQEPAQPDHGEHDHAQEDHGHPTRQELLLRKQRIHRAQRQRIAQILTLQTQNPETVFTPGQLRNLFRELPIDEGCMDEGLLPPGAYKYGIAGNASVHQGYEIDDFTGAAKRDRDFMRRLRLQWAHRLCAAQNKDDNTALAAALTMAERFNLDPGNVRMAGFTGKDDLRMRRDAHIHNAEILVLDHSSGVNEQHLGTAALKISTEHMPVSYVNRQIGVAQRVIEGEEGMMEVFGPAERTIAIVSGNTKQEIDALIRNHSAALDRFKRRPALVPLLRRA